MQKEVTIYDLARELKLSAATISRGLKNNKRINKDTAKRIISKAAEMGYRQNGFASSLRSKKTFTLGVIVHRLNSSFVAAVLAGMEDAASRESYNLIISQSLEKADKEINNAKIMFNKRVDGLLVSLAYNTADINHFEPFFTKGIPVVFFDRVQLHKGSTLVIIDNRKAAYLITKHLLDQGCRRIMHLGGNMLRNVYAERLNGYKQALAEYNIPFDESLVLISDLNEKSGSEAADYILQMEERPDAVFSSNDTAAVHCMIQLKQHGIDIPSDIAFAGFNNDPISKVVEPNLTTVNYSGYDIGETAVTSIINHIKGITNVKTTNTVILGSEIIIRESSLRNKPTTLKPLSY